jgi:peptidyl-prolyl cis-trans isomerase C
MELTRADYDAALAKMPENYRWEFATSPKRIQDLLNNLLLTKTLAAQARVHGVAPIPVTGKGPASDADRALAAAELQRIEADAAKSFEAQKTTFEGKAREIYDVDRDKYRTPEEVRLSDIAVTIKDRGEVAALARAREAHGRLVAGADFAAVAREYSDDPTTKDKGGALPFVSRRRLAAPYAKAVFALSKVGEISEPIKASAAYHVVRLEERRAPRAMAFDEVRESIVDTLRKKYVSQQRERRIEEIYRDPDMRVNQAQIDALVNRVDSQLLDSSKAASSPPAAGPAASPIAPK